MNDRIALTISAIVLVEPAAVLLWRALRWLWGAGDRLLRQSPQAGGWWEVE